MTRAIHILAGLVLAGMGAAAVLSATARAQAPAWPPRDWPTSYWPAKDWSYPETLEATRAAPNNFKLLWENEKTRLVEVTIRPGETTPVHANPLPAILAFDEALPPETAIVDTPADKNAGFNDARGGHGTPPPDKPSPTCATSAPRGPHTIANKGTVPMHYYRIEYKRIDGYATKDRWREWYPWMLQPYVEKTDLKPSPELGPPFSKDFPYPFAFDSVTASPKNHYVRYEDSRIRLIDVVGRPGTIENMHGHPYPSVFLNDTTESPAELEAVRTGKLMPSVDHRLYEDDPRNALWGQTGVAPDVVMLACRTMDPQAPHQNRRNADYPRHFMRIEFKRFEPYRG